MKKIILLIFCIFSWTCVFVQDIKRVNLEDFLIDPRCTSILKNDPQAEHLNIYGQNNSLYILGWSRDGKLAWLQYRIMEGSGYEVINFYVADLVEDVIICDKSIPSFDDIKKSSGDLINSTLDKYGIVLGVCKFQMLPAKDKNSNPVNFSINVLKNEKDEYSFNNITYEIVAEKLGAKKIVNTIKGTRTSFAKVTGFLKSPFESRIALVVADSEFVFEGEEVFVKFYGCNLEKGFLK